MDSDTEIQRLAPTCTWTLRKRRLTNLDVVVPSIGTVTGNGTISAAGQLNFKMSAKPAGAMGSMTSVMSLGGGKNSNSGGIPFTITGTTSNPVFLPDMAGVAGNAVKGVAGAPVGAAKAATGSLGGLFGKKKQTSSLA